MAGTDSQVIAGLYDVQNVQDRLRKYAQDQDVFRFWVLRQLHTVSLLRVISEKFGTAPSNAAAKEWEFKYPEFDEMQYTFNVSTNTVGNMNELSIANAQAVILNSNTRLIVDGIWTTFAPTAHTHFATAMNVSTGIVYPEELRILSVGAEDSFGTGYRKVLVKRGHPADSITTPTSIPAITTTMDLIVSNLVSKANAFPTRPVNKNSKEQSNVIQITRHSYGIGEMMNVGGGIETWLTDGAGYLDISYLLAETYMTKAIERAMITARKSKKEVGDDGDLELETGGIDEFVMADTDHILNLEGKVVSTKLMNNLVRRMADTCGVKELWMFTGTEASEQIANAYDNRTIYSTNGDLSMKYRLKVNTLESVGRDLLVHHVTAPVLNDLGRANEALILNLSEYNYNEKNPFGCFQVAWKVPFADKPDKADSFKENEGFYGKWRELYGAWGLVRRLPETHFRLINFASAN